jgi:hypothetical protein
MGQIKKGLIRGTVGEVVFKDMNGKQVLSTKPRFMRQTSAAKLHQVGFGKVSAVAGSLRSQLANLNNGFEDSTMGNRLTHELYQCIKSSFDLQTGNYVFEEDSFDGLSNFSFNTSSTVRLSLMVKPAVLIEAGILKITFPSFQVLSKITFPKRASMCEIYVAVSIFNLRTGMMVGMLKGDKFKIEKDQGLFEGKIMEFEAPEDCLFIISLFNYFYYSFHSYPTLMNNKTFHPCGIYKAVFNPGELK